MFLRCKICRRRGEGIAKEDFASLVTILFSNTMSKHLEVGMLLN